MRRSSYLHLSSAALVAAILVVGCDQASSPSTSASGSSQPSSSVSTAGASSSPSSAAPGVTFIWLAPTANARVTSYTLPLSVKSKGRAISKVRFIVGWSGKSKDACTATKAAADGTWGCKADLLKLGLAAGPLNVSIKATPADSTAAVAGGKRSITWDAKPPIPTKVNYNESAIAGATGGQSNAKVTISWKEAMTAGVTVKIYAVLRCLAPAGSTGKACVTNSSTIPASAMKLLRIVPAADGSTSWTFMHEDIGG